MTISILFMSIGFASINSIVINIDGLASATPQDGLFFTDILYDSSQNVAIEESKVLNMYQTMMQSKITLSSELVNSSITYKLTIYNNTDDDYYFVGTSYDNEFYSNSNITFSLTNIDTGSLVRSKDYIIFYITFKYNTDTVPDSNILESSINFNFEKGYKVTYENFTDTTSYPKSVYGNSNLVVNLGTLDAPIEVSKDGNILSSSSYTYSNNILTISNANGNIHIRKLKAYTITNMVKNGSFENNLTNWTIFGGSSGSWGITQIPLHGNNCAYRKASNTQANFLLQELNWISGHKYYFFAHAISVTNQTFTCDITNKGGAFSVTSIPSAYTRGSSIYESNFTGTNTISINFYKTTDNVNVDSIGVIDLTAAFGSGNEPDLNWCNNNINYFDNTATVYK